MSKIITLSYTNNFKPISDNKSQSLRIHCVSVRLNKEELELLNASRGDKRKGEWLRMASLQKLPPAIPAATGMCLSRVIFTPSFTSNSFIRRSAA